MSWLYSQLGFGSTGWGWLLLQGAGMTVMVSLVGLLLGSIFGGVVAWGKLSDSWLAGAIADSYAALFRGLPELLIVYFVYFGSSSLLGIGAKWVGYEGFVDLPPFISGALAVGVISGAYQAEVFRGAFLSVTRGELEAARSVGMHRWLMFRRILVPQILRFAIPGIGNLWQVALKDSSLISVTGLFELMRVSRMAGASTHQKLLFFLAGAGLYLLITVFSENFFFRAETYVTRGMRRV